MVLLLVYAKLIPLNQNNISYMSRLYHFNEIIFSINSIASVQFYPIHKMLNCYSSWCGCEWEQAFILLNVRSRGKKETVFKLKKKINLFKYGLFWPFSNSCLSCVSVMGKSHSAAQDRIGSLCCIFGNQAEMIFQFTGLATGSQE